MKIAQIVSTPPFAWTTGGPARVVFEISRALSKNHSVTIITTTMFREDKSYNQKILQNSIQGIDFQCFDNASRILAWNYKIYLSLGLIRYLRNHIHEYNVVHLHDLISFHAVAVMFFCRKNNVPYVLSPHGCLNWFIENTLIHKIFYHLFGRKILENANKITLLHPSEMDEIRTLGIPLKKCVTIPNGIDPLPFENHSRAGRFRRKHHVQANEKIILYLGRINKIKGIDLLVRAFSDLPKALRVKLVVAGRDEGYLRELILLSEQFTIQNNVIFTGPLTEDEKIDAYIDADVFVLPSLHEGFGITALEAIASATPIIITKGCNISDVVEDCGLVVDRDSGQLKHAIETILGNSVLREHFVKCGQEKIKNIYSWDCIAGRIEAIYEECLKETDYIS